MIEESGGWAAFFWQLVIVALFFGFLGMVCESMRLGDRERAPSALELHRSESR